MSPSEGGVECRPVVGEDRDTGAATSVRDAMSTYCLLGIGRKESKLLRSRRGTRRLRMSRELEDAEIRNVSKS